ncbi:MAG: hypothetical protein ACJ79M_02540 [Myxococcales bacterium]
MVCKNTPKHLRKAVFAAMLVVLGSAASARAQLQQFNPGSLIIPMEAPFQDPCGVVSAYGLVYKTLAASDALAAQGRGRVTVHWVYKDTKGSPNRCVPTNLHKNPQTPSTCPAPYTDPVKCPVKPMDDPAWNDGCDFAIDSQFTSPVTQIDNTTGSAMTPATGCGTKAGMFCTRNTTAGADATLSYPTFPGVVVQHSTTPSANVSRVQYMGGTFVIDATDAPIFLQLLNGKIKVNDTFGNPIDFSTFAKKTDIGACSYSFDGLATTFNNGFANAHWVNIHQAQAQFYATDSRQMNSTPAKIALLQTAGGKEGVGTPGGVIGDMLPQYLKSAGLNFTGAQGCSPTGYNAKQVPAGGTTTNCPVGKKSGYIFDSFDVMDLQDLNELNQTYKDSLGQTKNVYQNFWTPHWEGTTFPGCDGSCINKARQTILDFTKTRKVGLLAECGSIGVIEGSQGANPFDSRQPDITQQGVAAASWWYPPKPGTAGVYTDPLTGFSSTSTNPGEPPTRLMTCVETVPGSGVCSGSNTGTAGMRGTLHDVDPKNPTTNPNNYTVIGKARLRNCTDPNLAKGSNCMYYTSPGSAYAQIGDYLWFSRYGLLSNFKPNTGNTYASNVTPLGFTVLGVTNPGTSLDYATARTQSLADDFNFMLQPVGASKLNASQVIYLGGHTYSADVSGTRVVLNTMLALGVVPDSSETGYIGATEYNNNAFVPTYMRVTTPGAPSQWRTFVPAQADQWQFPYHTGHFRAHPVTGAGSLASNAMNDYNAALAFNGADAAAKLPGAGARNIFTYLGGAVATDATKPNGVAQKGWVPVDIDYPSVDPSSGCVDKFHIGEINSTTKPNYAGPKYAGMLPGADGVCDLQETLQLTPVSGLMVDSGGSADHGTTNGVSGGSIPTAFLGDLLNAKEMAQMVRGYCYATDATTNAFVAHPEAPGALDPNNSRGCNSVRDGFASIQDDKPQLGGFVHSQAAIVPASQFVADYPTGTHRPTVAYVGGLDGMLHAFYVPSDGLDLGYQHPANPVATANGDASAAFNGHTPYSSFTLTQTDALKELWAFVPPGQLPFLKSNNAVVDSSPVVIDAYGDFDGSGIRSWHTVLVASAGGNNRELFALDVTNPLKPVLLWDLQSSFDSTNLTYAPVPLADDETGKNLGTQAQAFAWQNGCHDATDPTAPPTCAVSDFKLPPAGSPVVTGLYNYGNLGASQSISVAQMRRFNSPLFAAFVATNEPQNKPGMGGGIFVFAIDVTNGQKVWEFNNPYKISDDGSDQSQAAKGNTPPAGVTLLSKAGNSLIDTAYVGDDEGALWELDAADGVNVNSFAPMMDPTHANAFCKAGQFCNFALSQAYGYTGSNGPQPISSLSTIFILPTMPSTSPLKKYELQPMLAYGTGGTDTISGMEPAPDATTGAPCPSGTNCINGAVHLVPLLPGYHYAAQDLFNNSNLLAAITQKGVLKTEPAGYPMFLANGERVFGSIVAAGDQLFFNTTTGTVSQIDSRGGLNGSSYRLLLSASSNALYNYVSATGLQKVGGAGGTPMLDATTGTLIVVTDKKILRFDPPPGGAGTLKGPSVNGRGATPTGLLSWFFRRRGLEY